MPEIASASASHHNDPPGPKLFPVLGMLNALRKDPLAFLIDARREHGGLVKLGQVGARSFLLVASPDGLRRVLSDNARNYERGPEFQVLRPVMGNSLIMRDGESWVRQRRMMAPAFHHQRMAGLVPTITAGIAEMLARWRSTGVDGGRTNVSREMIGLTLDLISRTMFTADISAELSRLVPAWIAANQWITDHIWLPVRVPERWPTPSNLALRRAMDVIRATITAIIRERRRSGEDRGDLLSTLLLARDAETGRGMDDAELLDELITIMFAGFETTALPLAWTWHFLSKYPDAWLRLDAEVRSVLEGRTPTADDLPRLSYTRRVFEESLRIYPPFWGFPRMAVRDDEVCGFRVRAGSTLVVSPYVTHHDPEHWEHPEAFDPERFTPERVAARHRFAYLPFGGGPRSCVGQSLAMMEAQLVIAMIAQRCRLHLGPEPLGVRVGNALRPSRDIQMQIRFHPQETASA